MCLCVGCLCELAESDKGEKRICMKYEEAEDKLFSIAMSGRKKSSATPTFRMVLGNSHTTPSNIRQLSANLLISEYCETLGEGSFGVCKKASLQDIAVCVKELRQSGSYGKQLLLHEASVLSKLCHESVCFMLGVQSHSVPYCVIVTSCTVDGFSIHVLDLISVNDWITLSPKQCVLKARYTSLDVTAWFVMMKKIAERLLHIHKLGIVHRDFKSDVVFYCHSYLLRPVIIDFGKSVYVRSATKFVLSDAKKAEYRLIHKHMWQSQVENEHYSVRKLLRNFNCF